LFFSEHILLSYDTLPLQQLLMLSERVNTCQTCWSSNVCVCWTQAAETPVWTSCYTVSSSQLDGSDPRPQRGLHPSWRRFVAGNISAFLTCVNKLKIYKFNTKILTYNKCLIQKYVTQNYKLNNCLMVFYPDNLTADSETLTQYMTLIVLKFFTSTPDLPSQTSYSNSGGVILGRTPGNAERNLKNRTTTYTLFLFCLILDLRGPCLMSRIKLCKKVCGWIQNAVIGFSDDFWQCKLSASMLNDKVSTCYIIQS